MCVAVREQERAEFQCGVAAAAAEGFAAAAENGSCAATHDDALAVLPVGAISGDADDSDAACSGDKPGTERQLSAAPVEMPAKKASEALKVHAREFAELSGRAPVPGETGPSDVTSAAATKAAHDLRSRATNVRIDAAVCSKCGNKIVQVLSDVNGYFLLNKHLYCKSCRKWVHRQCCLQNSNSTSRITCPSCGGNSLSPAQPRKRPDLQGAFDQG